MPNFYSTIGERFFIKEEALFYYSYTNPKENNVKIVLLKKDVVQVKKQVSGTILNLIRI